MRGHNQWRTHTSSQQVDNRCRVYHSKLRQQVAINQDGAISTMVSFVQANCLSGQTSRCKCKRTNDLCCKAVCRVRGRGSSRNVECLRVNSTFDSIVQDCGPYITLIPERFLLLKVSEVSGTFNIYTYSSWKNNEICQCKQMNSPN